jgi:hypothetical protein
LIFRHIGLTAPTSENASQTQTIQGQVAGCVQRKEKPVITSALYVDIAKVRIANNVVLRLSHNPAARRETPDQRLQNVSSGDTSVRA